MLANILNGKALAQKILQKVAVEITLRKKKGIPVPQIAVILLGNDPRSVIYVKNKLLACEQVGIKCKFLHLIHEVSQEDLLKLIDQLNQDPAINAILIQLPLPHYIDLNTIFTHIDPTKDVDGFHPYNLGLLAQGWPKLQPCTPRGIMIMLQSINIPLQGKYAVVVGSSNIVGKPMALCLINAGCTVTICNRNTPNLKSNVGAADLVISAAGQPKLIPGDWIKPGSIVIDVGITKVDNKLSGDIDFGIASTRAAWITKVPGGVGPMTVACLLENTLFTQILQNII